LRKVGIVCVTTILALFSLIFLLQTTWIAEASSPQKNDISAFNIKGGLSLSEPKRPKAVFDTSAVLPERFVIKKNEKNTVAAVSAVHEFTSSSMGTANSFPDYNYEMFGKVPYFRQSGDTCGLYSMMQVLWWYGRYVDASDIGDYLGKDEGPHYLWELDEAFAYYLPDSWHTYGGFEDAEEAKEWVKGAIYAGIPVICCIRAPGTTTAGWANHYVTIVGWDDTLDGGAWCLHDTGGFWTGEVGADTDYDVWCLYSDFDDLWDEWWTASPGSYDTRGVVAAYPGDEKYSQPQVSISGLHDIYDDETMTLQVSLTNIGQDESKSTGPNGIYVRFDSAEIIDVNLESFDDYNSFDLSGTALGHVLPTRIIEFYDYDPIVPGVTISASITVRPIYRMTNAAVSFRGWITDEDDITREDWIVIDDDRPDPLITILGEPRILRDPFTGVNDVDDVLYGYPLHREYFSVLDDDPDPPDIWGLESSGDVFDNYTGNYILTLQASDASEFKIGIRYKFGSDPWSSDPWSPWYEYGYPGFGDYVGLVSIHHEIPRSEWIQHVGSTLYWQVRAEDFDADTPSDGAITTIIEVGGRILDDDTHPPPIMDPGLYVGEKLYPIEGVSDSYSGNIRLQITIGSLKSYPLMILRDPSGISTVRFWVFDSWRNATGFSDYTYWYDIPAEEWKNHIGETWLWKVYVEDNDSDRPDDHTGTESSLYPGTEIWDDDTTAPMFLNPSSEYIEDTGSFRIQIYAGDHSGIYTVRFRYRFEDGSWTSWQAPTESLKDAYWYDIPLDVWGSYCGQTVYWQAYAEDNDNDRFGDRANSLSAEYSAPLTGMPILQVTAESPVNILVTDPNGLRVGYDPLLGSINEVPGATYSGQVTEPQVITIPSPIEGTYTVDAFGTGTGVYTIRMDSYASDGSISSSEIWSGIAEPGQQYTQAIELEADGNIIDATPPTTEAVLTGTSGLNGWYISNVNVELIANDAMSVVATTEYSFDGTTWLPYLGTPIVLSNEGTTIIYYHSTDNKGNIEDIKTETIRIDKTPPDLQKSLSGTEGTNGWFISDVTVTLKASDTTSGVASVQYSFDGSTWYTYSTPFTISTEGTTTLHHKAYDNAGNEFILPSQEIRIDKTPPTITGAPTTSPNAYGWYNSDVIVHFEASDALSGIQMIIPDQTLTMEGADQSVTGTATDIAGNSASYTVVGIHIDKTPPTITGAPTTMPNVYGWYNNDITVHFTASDALSGLDIVTPDQTLMNEGAGQSVIGVATDRAGNSASCTVDDINIDKTKPATTLTIGEPKFENDPTYVSTTTDFNLDPADTLSGIEYTEYKIDSGPWTLYSVPFNVLDFGSHTIYYHSIDLAGNSEDIQSFSIIVQETRLTYQGDTDGQYSDQVALKAKLIDMATQLPIQGKLISFTLGSQTATATTDHTGIASVNIVIIQPMGAYTVTATFETDDDYLGSSASQSFTILKENVSVEYTGDTVVPTTTKSINLRATVFESIDGWLGDLTTMQVTFNIVAGQLGSTPYMTICTVAVSSTDMPGVGVAVATIDNLPGNDYFIIVDIDPNDYYASSASDATALIVYEPTDDFVTGGGWIYDSFGSIGHFGFNVRYNKHGNLQGSLLYVYYEGGWNYIVKSNAWIGMAIEGNHAYFEAKCLIQKYNPATGELIWSEDNYKFRVDVWDTDSYGGIDIYQIRVWDKNGVVYHEAGFNPIGRLQGGNIVIHDVKKERHLVSSFFYISHTPTRRNQA